MLLKAFNAEFVAVGFGLCVSVGSLQVLDLHLIFVLISSFLLDYLLEFVESLLLELGLRLECLVVMLKLLDMLGLRYLVVLQSGDCPLQLGLVRFLVL